MTGVGYVDIDATVVVTGDYELTTNGFADGTGASVDVNI